MNKKNIIAGIIVLILLGITSLLIYTSKAFYEVSESFNFINSRYYEEVVVEEFLYTGNIQTFVVPQNGYYKIETWGAEGKSISSYTGGKGGYSSGEIYLTKDEVLYIQVGGKGASAGTLYGGYNGGGSITSGQQSFGAPGGGATDIRLIGGIWSDSTSLRSRIMVAAGGGGANNRSGGYGSGNAGSGGGLIGHFGQQVNHTNGHGSVEPSGGTQISGGYYYFGGGSAGPEDTYYYSAFGYFATSILVQAGLGAGYYTGSIGGHAGAGGGSSYISGYAGVNSVIETGGTEAQPLHTNNTMHYSNKYFINGTMKSGEEEMPNIDGTLMTGNTGHGKAKITYISRMLSAKTNSDLNNVRYIKDCINGSSTNVENHWYEIQAIKDGNNVALNKNVIGTVPFSTVKEGYPYTNAVEGNMSESTRETENYAASAIFGLQCVTVDLGQTYDLDEVVTWHYYQDGRSYNNHTLSVGATNESGTISLSTVLINDRSGALETSQGFRFSAWN